ncbi:MAG: XdhC/CoxI family protein [Bryobacterales bacterium]|nr:XdhC/CoxI family protein [Bryobacterales bacterium]
MDVFEELVRLRKLGRKCALATIIEVRGSIPSHENAKMLIRDDGSFVGTVGGGCVEAEVWDAAREVIASERPQKLSFNLGHDASYENGLICGGQLDIYVEPILPQPKLLLFGGGHISKSICRVAAIAGFGTAVIDDRESFVNAERFPDAEATLSGEYEEIFPTLAVTGDTYVVIVTRGHRDDMRILRWAVTTPARYVAMVGSKRKVISTVKELEKEGLPRSLFERLHAPMGLDIGAVSPEEIAVSVVAEMIAVRRNPEADWRNLAKSVFAHDELKALLK